MASIEADERARRRATRRRYDARNQGQLPDGRRWVQLTVWSDDQELVK